MAINDILLSRSGYEWKFCSLGGVTRVNIANGSDIAHLGELDKKLWTVLSCPVTGLEFDEKTLSILDTGNDGKIRVDEIVATAKWLTTILKDPDILLKKGDTLHLNDFNIDNEEGRTLQSSASRILENLGLQKDSISIEDTQDRVAIFAKTRFNGDGIITVLSSDDETVQKDITSCIETMGGVTDRCGEEGVDADKINAFYTVLQEYYDWQDKGEHNKPTVFPYGENTAAAYEAVLALKDKVNDFFMRCNFIAFDDKCSEALDVNVEKVAAISGDNLGEHDNEIATYPLARPVKAALLPVREGVNPAWKKIFDKFKTLVLDVDFADKDAISQDDWNGIVASFDAYAAWLGEKKGEVVESLGFDRVKELLAANNKETMLGLVEKDNSLKEESESIEKVEKLLYLRRDFYRLLRNYVIFTDFYDRTTDCDTTFQVGRLFIDQRSCDLCVRVDDMSKHASIATASNMFLVYCKCTSKVRNATMDIAAAITKGSVNTLYVGLNAVFYDRKGQDWDAVVTKIVDNPISLSYAFGTPYRKLGKLITDQIDKLAAEKDAKVNADLSAKADIKQLLTDPADGEAAAAPKKMPFDIAKFAGIFAAIGLAFGALAAALTGLLRGFLALNWWQMLVVIAIILLLISGPSMYIAWHKLRNRNLGPLLNANGWAINSRVLVNSRFGSTLTSTAKYPKIKTDDPYAEKTPLWARILRWVVVIAIVVLCVCFFRRQKFQKEARAQYVADSIARADSIAAAGLGAIVVTEAVGADDNAAVQEVVQ